MSLLKKCLFLICFLLPLHLAAQDNWQQLYEQAKALSYSNPDQSISLLERAIPLAVQELGEGSEQYANLINDLGLAYWVKGETGKAQALFEESLSLKREIYGEDGPDYAASLINLAGTYRESRYLRQSKVLYLEAIDVLDYHKEDRPEDYTLALNYYGNLLLEARDQNGAYQQLSSALAFAEVNLDQNHPIYATTLSNLGRLMIAAQRQAEAEQYLRQAGTIYQKSRSDQAEAYSTVLQLLGDLYRQKSDFGQAEAQYRQAASIREQFTGRAREQYAITLNSLATLYYAINSNSKAEEYYQRSARIIKELVGDQHEKYASAINNLARFYSNTEQLDQAEQLYLQASAIYKSYYGESHPSYSATINNLAVIYRKRGQLDQALRMYMQVLQADSASLGTDHPIFATTLTNVGTLHMAKGEMAFAERAFVRATNIRREQLGENHPDFARSLDKLALFYYGQGEFAKAEPLFTESILINKRKVKSLFPSLSESEKEDYYNSIRTDLEKYNSIVLQRMEANPELISTMYDNQLETKAILFNASNKMRNAILNSGDVQLINKFRRWRSLKNELAQYYTLNRQELDRRGIDTKAVERQINDLEKELGTSSSLFAREVDVVRHSWQEIAAKLDRNQAAVEIIRFREFSSEASEGGRVNFGFSQNIYYVALIIKPDTREHPEIVVLDNGKELETTYQANYKNAIRYRIDDNYSYEQYWSAISARLKGVDQVYISADGIYNVINPNILKNPATGAYVIDEIDIRFISNTRDLLTKEESESTIKNAVLVGNPAFIMEPGARMRQAGTGTGNDRGGASSISLDDIPYGNKYFSDLPGARQEIIDIDKITAKKGWKNKTYIGDQAIEEVIKSLNNPKVLHIATHGFFSDDVKAAKRELGVSVSNPLFRSGVMLAGSGTTTYDRNNGQGVPAGVEDGILTAYEAMNLNLDKTDLVVLSACETGLGEIVNGEGVYGLQRAFRVAGADAVLISLFKVEDKATQELMTLFYEEWIKLGDKQQAFKAAQIKFRDQYPDPYYWGSFIMSGQ